MGHIVNKEAARLDFRRLTVRDMLRPLFRNWKVVAITFAVVLAGAFLVAFGWAKHYYVATMQVIVERERSNPTVTGQQNAAAENTTSVTADEIASEIVLLQGRDMLEEVARICQLGPGTGKALEVATQALAGDLRVEEQRTSHVIEVSYGRYGSPETPACVLQTLGKLYLEKHLRLQRPAGTFDFFAQETDKYQQALADSESRLEEFSKSRGMAAPDVLRASTAQQLVTSESNLYEARQMIATNQRRIENLEDQIGETPSRSSTEETSLSANMLLEQLQSSLLASQLKRTQLLLKYDPFYPLVKEVEEEIAQTKDAIAKAEDAKYINTSTDRDPTFEYLRQDLAKSKADLASEQAKTAALVTTVQGIRAELVDLDQQTVRQAALLREAKANEENYLLYLTKREQERTSDALDQKRIANVAIAVPAQVPVLPAHSATSIVFTGFWIALFVGICVGYFIEAANPSFRTPSEVEELLNVSVLAAVPKQAA